MKGTGGVLAIVLLLSGCARSTGALVTAPVTRADVNQSVTATGTVNAQDMVLVGSQVSGTIAQLLVDYNSVVREGQILARLDPSTFTAALTQAQSVLAQTQAQQSGADQTARAALMDEESAQATIRQTQSALALARKNAERDNVLLSKGFVAQTAVDADENAVVAAASGYRSALSQQQAASSRYNAAVAAERAASQLVAANRAAVRQAQINLDHATISSPVAGTVIQRNVSVGQTVAAALAAPTLFTIARDLGKMEVDIAVGEPDVGAVHSGQPVDFTVLAYPGTTFRGTVFQVRQNPTIVQNVTTYDTVVYAENRNGRLRPGMTANATIVIARYPRALVVPLAALQWRPTAPVAQKYHLAPRTPSPSRTGSSGSQWGQTGNAAAAAIVPNGRGRLFVDNNGKITVVPVTILAVNGTSVAVKPAGEATLDQGEAVVIDVSK